MSIGFDPGIEGWIINETKDVAAAVSAQFPLTRLSILLHSEIILKLKHAQNDESVHQFLTFLVVRCHANSFLDAIKNRVTRVRDSVGELSRVKVDHCQLVEFFPIRREGNAVSCHGVLRGGRNDYALPSGPAARCWLKPTKSFSG